MEKLENLDLKTYIYAILMRNNFNFFSDTHFLVIVFLAILIEIIKVWEDKRNISLIGWT